MTIEYEKDYLKELYESGKCKNKKYRFDAAVIKKYQKRIDTLMACLLYTSPSPRDCS